MNNEASGAFDARIDVGAAVTSGLAVYLHGPSSGTTLAGAGVSPTGAWTPTTSYAATVNGNVATILVPPASVALVMIR